MPHDWENAEHTGYRGMSGHSTGIEWYNSNEWMTKSECQKCMLIGVFNESFSF